MNNIRQIIEERLDNARNDYNCCSFESTLRPILNAQMEAYTDVLNLIPEDIGELSDGYHTFNSLYEQRMYLFATLVNLNNHKSWKSYKHEDGQLCFGGGWFIVGIDTPEGSYTYHYENKYWHLFDCQELETAKHWDGHTDKDIARVLSITPAPRTEADILKDFEKLGYRVIKLSTMYLFETDEEERRIWIHTDLKEYGISIANKALAFQTFTMQEHKLLNELFEVWQWI